MKFYFIDIQSLCKIIEKEEAKFQPCEIAVVEYSLHSGISKSFHRFIDPGEEEGGGGERGREGGREGKGKEKERGGEGKREREGEGGTEGGRKEKERGVR